MALAERVNAGPDDKSIPGLPCSIGALLDKLEGDDREALLVMLGTPEKRGWTQRQIYETLTAEGYVVGRQTPNRHRAGTCRCVA